MLSCWQRAVVRASTRNRWVSSGWLDCRNLIATRRPSRRSRARNTLPIPPSPIILIISYWLIRTPGCGAALVACTPVVPEVSSSDESNVSHADLLKPDGAFESRLPRGLAGIVCACGGETGACVPGGAEPLATVVGLGGAWTVLMPNWAAPTPTIVRCLTGCTGAPAPCGSTVVASCGP